MLPGPYARRAWLALLALAAAWPACRQRQPAESPRPAGPGPARQVWQREVGPQHQPAAPALVTADGRVVVLGSQPAPSGLRRSTLFILRNDGKTLQEVAGADFEGDVGRGLPATGALGPDGQAYFLDGAGGLFVVPPTGDGTYLRGFARPRPGGPAFTVLSSGELAVAGEDDITVTTAPATSTPAEMKWRVWQRARALLAGGEGWLYFVGSQGAGALRPDGGLAWSAAVDGGEALALARSGDLLVGSSSAVVALDGAGRRSWELRKSADGPAGLALAPDGRLITASAREVLALAPDGRLAWSWRLPQGEPALTEAPLVGPDGVVYVASGGRHVLSAAGAPAGRLAGFPAGTLSVVSNEAFYVRSAGALHALLLQARQP